MKNSELIEVVRATRRNADKLAHKLGVELPKYSVYNTFLGGYRFFDVVGESEKALKIVILSKVQTSQHIKNYRFFTLEVWIPKTAIVNAYNVRVDEPVASYFGKFKPWWLRQNNLA